MHRWRNGIRFSAVACLLSGGLAFTMPADAATVNVSPATYNNTLVLESTNYQGRTIYLREGDQAAGWIHMQYYHGWQADYGYASTQEAINDILQYPVSTTEQTTSNGTEQWVYTGDFYDLSNGSHYCSVRLIYNEGNANIVTAYVDSEEPAMHWKLFGTTKKSQNPAWLNDGNFGYGITDVTHD